MNYRDLGNSSDQGDDGEDDVLDADVTPRSQPDDETGGEEPRPRSRGAWRGPAAIAALALVAVAAAAAWSIQRGGDSTPTPAAVTSSATRPPAPIAAPDSAVTSTPPSTTAAAAATPAAAVAPVTDPQQAAQLFLHTWGQRTIGATKWSRQVRALCDARGWFLMQGTDPANVPKFTVKGTPMVTPDGGTKAIEVSVKTSIGSSLVTFVRGAGGVLLMHNFVVPGGMS